MHRGEFALLAHLGQERQQRGLVLQPVDLVDHQHHRDAGVAQHVVGQGVFFVPAAGFDHHERGIDLFQRTARGPVHHPAHGRCRELALLLVQAGGVDQHDLPRRPVLAGGERGDAEQAVPGGLRPVGSDADLGAHQGVGQGGLAHVGATDHGNAAAAVGRGIAHRGGTHLEMSSFSSRAAAAACSALRREVPSPSAVSGGSSVVHRATNCLAWSSPLSSTSS